MVIRVLLTAPTSAGRSRFDALLRDEEVVVRPFEGAVALWKRLSQEEFDVLIIDRSSLPERPRSLVESIRKLPDSPDVVVLTRDEDPRDRASLLASGCLAVVNSTLEDDILRELLRSLLERRRGESITRLKAERPEERFSLNDFVSESPAMQVFIETARKVVQADSSLLILGETGVGKERLARAIHAESARSAGPFMAVNCGALPEGLLESELFGHEEGAFTGATRSRRGYFELAHSGTIFLDEIGEMPSHLQVKLLRALEDRRIQRVGGEKPITVDVRVMAATNKNLEAEVEARRFRPDLFYRLAVVTLEIPPLRERREDIPNLVGSYLSHFRTQTGQVVTDITPEALNALIDHDWPGNVRELINTVERAVLLGVGEEISIEDLPERIRAKAGNRKESRTPPSSHPRDPFTEDWLEKSLPEARREIIAGFDRDYLNMLLERTEGRVGEAAHRAGISERSLYELMKRHHLRKETFRSGSRRGRH